MCLTSSLSPNAAMQFRVHLIYYQLQSEAMDEYLQLTAEYIRHKYKLPKLAAKHIEQANRLINDQNAAIKDASQKNMLQPNTHARLSARDSSRTYKHLKRVPTIESDLASQERHLISIKMRKFKPANGSFSQFYGEKISMDLSRSKRNLSKLNIPELDFSKHDSRSKQHPPLTQRLPNEKSLSSAILQRSERKNGQPYIEKLQQIRETGDMLRENSKFLIKRANNASITNENNYEKLEDESNRILTGEEKFVLEEQLSKTYRHNALLGQIRWRPKV